MTASARLMVGNWENEYNKLGYLAGGIDKAG